MPSDPLVIAFDTSAAHCAAALLCGDRLIDTRHEGMARGQGERLFPLLEDMLSAAGLRWAALDAVAVGVGPGNFTGIRISVAAARGLALGLGVPAIGVSTFAARAHGLPRPLIVAEDARRDRVYLQRFTPEAQPPVLCTPDEVRCDAPVAGSGAELLGAVPVTPRHDLASAIAHEAMARLGTPQPRPAPLYIRPADAAPPARRAPAVLA